MTAGAMGAFVGRRLALLLALLLVVSFLVFSLLYLAPGDAVQVLLGTRPASPELLQTLRAEYHLDRPFLEQYWLWLQGAVQLDFGDSTRTGRSVVSSIRDRLGVTLFLGIYAFVISIVAGVALGMLAAVRRRATVDRGVVGAAVLGVSTPAFVTGVFLLYVFAVRFGWFPAFGPGEGLVDRFTHLTLPALALALGATALIVKLSRAAMITALEQDYVAFALARGVPMRHVLVRYALRNALVPIITAAGLVLAVVLTSTVLVETVFALPGLGALLVESVNNKDLPVLQGVVVLLAAAIVLINLVIDVLYVLVDPRIGFDRVSA